eukprot:CAMPEP_0116917458 /NCGR_PEP_ID=MMETSP0467-20121206/19157_1 /TAXON_ID=283647 /ORGANISM="Mesodinium pulex, Strain SPMC105" /LENGTH=45 /DNA_ID= /DNA_START= /DNA_END= /DNA_ORIENTATION=
MKVIDTSSHKDTTHIKYNGSAQDFSQYEQLLFKDNTQKINDEMRK